MSKNIIILIVVAVVVVVGFMFYQNSGAPGVAPEVSSIPKIVGDRLPPVTPAQTAPATSSSMTKGVEHTVTFSGDAFSPKELTIKKGDIVKWTNNGNRNIWPASANHPTHTKYPGSGIEKCDTPERSKIFDACTPGIASGKSWSFQFNEVGSWAYHDHLRSTIFGKIIVTQ